jgi:hypothetical protein
VCISRPACRTRSTQDQTRSLPSFPAADKRKDPRYSWFVRTYGQQCWEVDALDPNELRDCVRKAIEAEIEKEAWERCKNTERAEQQSLRAVMRNWGKPQAGLVWPSAKTQKIWNKGEVLISWGFLAPICYCQK